MGLAGDTGHSRIITNGLSDGNTFLLVTHRLLSSAKERVQNRGDEGSQGPCRTPPETDAEEG